MTEELLDLQKLVRAEIEDVGLASNPEKNSEVSCVRQSCWLPHVAH